MAYKTLTETCYFKTGREGVVFEATDLLKPNLFDNNKNIDNSIFHKNSKIRFTLIDARRTQGKGKALYYNLNPDEMLLLNYLLSDGIPAHFKKRVGAYNSLSGQEQLYIRNLTESFDSIDFARFDRVMDYSKKTEGTAVTLQKNILDFNSGGDKLIVRKMTMSYEEAMRSASKWKITIEEGEGIKDKTKGNGLNIIKNGTYKTINKTYLMLQPNEIVIPVNEAAKRVIISQNVFYSLMKKAEDDFTRRKFENNDFEGTKIDEWNPQGKSKFISKSKEKTENNQIRNKAEEKSDEESKEEIKNEEKKEAKPEINNEEKKCSGCGTIINNKVYDYSLKFYKKPLCFNCQKKEKK